MSDAFIFILSLKELYGPYLSVLLLSTVWGSDESSCRALWEFDKALHISVPFDFLSGDDIKMSVYAKDKLNCAVPNENEVLLTVLHCSLSEEVPGVQFNIWRVGIGEFPHASETPIILSQNLASERLSSSSESPSPLTFLRLSRLTRSGRFVVVVRDARGSRGFYASSCARIASGDLRLVPIEAPCDGDMINVDRKRGKTGE